MIQKKSKNLKWCVPVKSFAIFITDDKRSKFYSYQIANEEKTIVTTASLL